MGTSLKDIATKADIADLIQELKALNNGYFIWMLFFFITQVAASFLIFYFLSR
jgi:hypothetical protein